jgi:hypothetical protein
MILGAYNCVDLREYLYQGEGKDARVKGQHQPIYQMVERQYILSHHIIDAEFSQVVNMSYLKDKVFCITIFSYASY